MRCMNGERIVLHVRGGKVTRPVARFGSDRTLADPRLFGGMKGEDVKRLKELERENSTLKRIVANKELEIEGLREISKGNW
jgi:hypothetical protein